MRCNVCGYPGSNCQQSSARCDFFESYLDSNYLDSMIVPCFARRQLHNMIGKLFIALDSEQEEYVFCLKKGLYKTHIYGDGYEKFISNYDLKDGDKVRVEMDTPAPYFRIRAISGTPIPMESVSEDDGETDVSKDDGEAYAYAYDGSVVVYSKGLVLTDAQTTSMNSRVLARAPGMGAVLVHKLTATDVSHNGMRIPKKIVSALKIQRKGWVLLVMGDYDNYHEAEYYTQSDGRIRFKTGWEKFHLPVGLIVLVMFHEDTSGYVKISVDAI